MNFVCAFQGLNILANTCNGKTVDLYTKFTDHVASEALANEDTVAVVNRRCGNRIETQGHLLNTHCRGSQHPPPPIFTPFFYTVRDKHVYHKKKKYQGKWKLVIDINFMNLILRGLTLLHRYAHTSTQNTGKCQKWIIDW